MKQYNVVIVTKGVTRAVIVSACNQECAKSLVLGNLKSAGVLAIAIDVIECG
jgi:hypothetical protein